MNRIAAKRAGVLPLALAVAVAAPTGARGQETAPAEPPAVEAPGRDGWRVSVSTGVGGMIQWMDLFAEALGGPTQTDFYQVGLRVDREVGNASFGLGYTRQHWRDVDPSRAGDDVVSTVDLFIFDARARWLRTTWVDLYSGGGVGFASWDQSGGAGGVPQTETSASLAFQLRLLGVDAGWEHVRLWGELGFGFEGVLLAGASYRF